MKINPKIDLNALSQPSLNDAEILKDGVLKLVKKNEATPHSKILHQLISQFEPIDFLTMAYPEVEHLRNQLAKLDPESSQTSDIRKRLDKFKINILLFRENKIYLDN